MLESSHVLVAAAVPVAILDDVAHTTLLDGLLHRSFDSAALICVGSGCRCCHVVYHWSLCICSATTTDAASVAGGFFRVLDACHDILLLCALSDLLCLSCWSVRS